MADQWNHSVPRFPGFFTVLKLCVGWVLMLIPSVMWLSAGLCFLFSLGNTVAIPLQTVEATPFLSLTSVSCLCLQQQLPGGQGSSSRALLPVSNSDELVHSKSWTILEPHCQLQRDEEQAEMWEGQLHIQILWLSWMKSWESECLPQDHRRT